MDHGYLFGRAGTVLEERPGDEFVGGERFDPFIQLEEVEIFSEKGTVIKVCRFLQFGSLAPLGFGWHDGEAPAV